MSCFWGGEGYEVIGLCFFPLYYGGFFEVADIINLI